MGAHDTYMRRPRQTRPVIPPKREGTRQLRLLQVLLVLWLLACCSLAFATQRALLVGVSELVNQPQALWLQAPRNDVLLMRDALQKQGFAATDIAVLADGVNGAALPEAQAIHDALTRLLAQSRSGDFVLLYFSGHGTRLRDIVKRYQEPDGLSENFLARDVRGTLGSDSALAGDLRDVDFDAWIQSFLAKNVFVASVFDTCSANSMTRGTADAPPTAEGTGDDEVRWRGLRATQLAGGAPPARAPAPPVPAEAVPRARYVAFFASESHQITPELRLPRKARNARPQGLLTWAMVEALSRKPATWRELFDGVLALYPPVIDELAQRFPTRELPSPVAEGNLDAPLFANSGAPASTRPVWRAQRSGDSLAIKAGLLDGLAQQQELRVLATLDDGTVRGASATVAQIKLGGAWLGVPAALKDVPGSAFWSVTPMGEPAATALRVRADKPLPAGLSLDYPAAIRPADAAATADVRWTDLGSSGQRLELLAPLFGANVSTVVLPDTAALRRRLQALAQLKWLAQLQGYGKDGQLDGFDAALEAWSADRMLRSVPIASVAQAANALPPPRPGERLRLSVRNTSGRSLDLVIAGIDARGNLQPVYPDESGETNRFKRGTPEQPSVKRFDLPWLDAAGDARLLVMAVPATPYSAPRLFGVAYAQADVSEVRVRGGQPPADSGERQVFAALLRRSGTADVGAKP
ncbi:Caspase domain-containing protein [Variovorax sp. NFACC28]|nr:Caspase domain-containing protein [Variovorax sp. NFACC28]SEG53452.1 Caspase domain-containing protein [Variovorax sp. NFACC29]SFC15966.1 Caspase domain-containing protein [Variovorax sp. NFACC26]SFH10583.1 Caspase domain-containing protein [Variovorax sp. NFACC27]